VPEYVGLDVPDACHLFAAFGGGGLLLFLDDGVQDFYLFEYFFFCVGESDDFFVGCFVVWFFAGFGEVVEASVAVVPAGHQCSPGGVSAIERS
jgi:hypothetical protein